MAGRKHAVKTLLYLIPGLLLMGLSFVAPEASAKAAQGGTIVLDQASSSLGDTVTFTTTTSGLKGNQAPRIQVMCYQGTDLVYGEAGPASQGFLLGGAGSVWLTNGGPAHCVATLYYWGFHPTQTFVPLASTEFDAGG